MGHWQQKSRPWYEVSIINCVLCGQMVPSEIWVSDEQSCKGFFCSPECEKMYLEYWLPRHGGKDGKWLPGS